MIINILGKTVGTGVSIYDFVLLSPPSQNKVLDSTSLSQVNAIISDLYSWCLSNGFFSGTYDSTAGVVNLTSPSFPGYVFGRIVLVELDDSTGGINRIYSQFVDSNGNTKYAFQNPSSGNKSFSDFVGSKQYKTTSPNLFALS